MEATGGYEQPVLKALAAAKVKVALLQPERVMHFARSQGTRAKTDALDCEAIANFAAMSDVRAWVARSAADERVAMTSEFRCRPCLVRNAMWVASTREQARPSPSEGGFSPAFNPAPSRSSSWRTSSRSRRTWRDSSC